MDGPIGGEGCGEREIEHVGRCHVSILTDRRSESVEERGEGSLEIYYSTTINVLYSCGSSRTYLLKAWKITLVVRMMCSTNFLLRLASLIPLVLI